MNKYNNFIIEPTTAATHSKSHIATCTDEHGAIFFSFGTSHEDALTALITKLKLFTTINLNL